MPLQLRGCLAEQYRSLFLGRGLGRLEHGFDPSILLNPLVLLQIVDGHLPAFRGAENENTDMLLRGVEGPHRVLVTCAESVPVRDVNA